VYVGHGVWRLMVIWNDGPIKHGFLFAHRPFGLVEVARRLRPYPSRLYSKGIF
jgi:hypothetical protein